MMLNTLCLMGASSAVVWGIAPNRSFGAPRLPFQASLARLPSNVFDVCGPQRQYTLGSRAASFAAKVGTGRLPPCHLAPWHENIVLYPCILSGSLSHELGGFLNQIVAVHQAMYRGGCRVSLV